MWKPAVPECFASPDEYAAVLRIALHQLDTSGDLPADLSHQALADALARLDCAPEERLVRVVQLLSALLADWVSTLTDEHDPVDSLRGMLLSHELDAAATT